MAPLGVLVSTEHSIMTDSPRVDILIIKKKSGQWTPNQLKLIPDGIRESKAKYILLEFKYSQSLSDKTFQQALGYDYFFGETYHLYRNELQTFIISSKTPQAQILKDYGYRESKIQGVYKSDIRAFKHFPLLILNNLPLTYHNALIKAFASRKAQRDSAAKLLQDKQYLNIINKGVKNIIFYIFRYFFNKQKEDITMKKMTEEEAEKMARFIDVFVNTNLSLGEILSLHKPEDVMSHFKPEDVMSHFKPEDVIPQFNPKDIVSSLDKKQLKEVKQYINMM